MTHFTLDDLVEFTQNEKKMIEAVMQSEECRPLEPDEQAVANILAYARALSVRKSRRHGNFSMVLN